MRASSPRPGLILVAVVLFALAVKAFVLDAAVVEGRSMLPLLAPGAIVLVLRCAYGLRLPSGSGYLLRWAEPKVGQVVAASNPRDGKSVVKRVASLDSGGLVFLAGDNAPESVDSRDYGPVSLGAVRGRVILIGSGGSHD
jgi:signal peptidase I